MSASATAAKRITAEEFYDFLQLPENEHKLFELVRGEVIELPSPTIPHGFICANFARILGNYTYDQGTGYVTSNDTGIILERDPDTVRGPDIALYRESEQFVDLHPKYGETVPILAVEVLSPEDRAGKVMRKIDDYLRGGVSLVWVVDPETLSVTVYRADKAPALRSKDDLLSGDEIIPGFQYRVADFFKTPGDRRAVPTHQAQVEKPL